MTVAEALKQKREERKDNLTGLVLCKRELFYLPEVGNGVEDSVYPVSYELAEREAKFFKVPLQEA